METRFLLGRFLVRLNRLFSGKEDSVISDISSDEVSRILNIKDYIQETYSESLRVEDIAHRFFISKTQLYRLFHSVLGISVGDYILQVRMIRAKDLLRNSDFSVERIAEEVGYQNLSAFSRAFKANVGISPHAFRKNNT